MPRGRPRPTPPLPPQAPQYPKPKLASNDWWILALLVGMHQKVDRLHQKIDELMEGGLGAEDQAKLSEAVRDLDESNQRLRGATEGEVK